MRREPVAFRNLYETGDTITFIDNGSVEKYGSETAYEVIRANSETVTVRVNRREVTVPTHHVVGHTARPAWREPGYLKYG